MILGGNLSTSSTGFLWDLQNVLHQQQRPISQKIWPPLTSFVEVLRVILFANIIKNKGENEIILILKQNENNFLIEDFDQYYLIQNWP